MNFLAAHLDTALGDDVPGARPEFPNRPDCEQVGNRPRCERVAPAFGHRLQPRLSAVEISHRVLGDPLDDAGEGVDRAAGADVLGGHAGLGQPLLGQVDVVLLLVVDGHVLGDVDQLEEQREGAGVLVERVGNLGLGVLTDEVRHQRPDGAGRVPAVLLEFVDGLDAEPALLGVAVDEHRHPVDEFPDRRPDAVAGVRVEPAERREDSVGVGDDLPVRVWVVGHPLGSGRLEGRSVGLIVRIEGVAVVPQERRFRLGRDGVVVLDGVGDATDEIPNADVASHRLVEFGDGDGERPGDVLDGVVTPREVALLAAVCSHPTTTAFGVGWRGLIVTWGSYGPRQYNSGRSTHPPRVFCCPRTNRTP